MHSIMQSLRVSLPPILLTTSVTRSLLFFKVTNLISLIWLTFASVVLMAMISCPFASAFAANRASVAVWLMFPARRWNVKWAVKRSLCVTEGSQCRNRWSQRGLETIHWSVIKCLWWWVWVSPEILNRALTTLSTISEGNSDLNTSQNKWKQDRRVKSEFKRLQFKIKMSL